jgi:hypothetical protein
MNHDINWDYLYSAPSYEAKGALFGLLQEAAEAIQVDDKSPELLELVPRIADVMERRADLHSYQEIFGSFARAVGLWNYIDKKYGTTQDRLIAETATSEGLGGLTFHKGQVEALNILLSGRSLVLSAPTSFGKSLLIDALLATKRYRRVAIIVPTIALLDEFRRRIQARFNRTFHLILHANEVDPGDRPVIFLGTQERLIGRTDFGKLDLVVVDEFYKLDTDDGRSTTLNAVVYKLLHRAKQFFFLGPNIAQVIQSKQGGWEFSFLATRFSTVAVNTFDLNNVPDKSVRLLEEVFKESNWPLLTFVSSPDRAQAVASQIAGLEKRIGRGEALAEWIAQNFGARWRLVEAVRYGVGVHHARVPRSLAARFVKLFNDRVLPVLICTSTLIEGVNTAAKSVLIFDKDINRKDYDFFTFSNIRGRAGRLGEHHVGNVFLFNSPPDAKDTDVSPPLFAEADVAPDEFAIHMDENWDGPEVGRRTGSLAKEFGVAPEELRRFSGLGFDKLRKIKELVTVDLRSSKTLVWFGWATFNDILSVAEIACSVKRSVGDLGVFSPRQLAFFICELRSPRPLKDFFGWYFGNQKLDDKFQENIFRFLRACEHVLPEIFGAVEMFCRAYGARVDYSMLIAELASWFRPVVVKQLEEQGIPVQISERFYSEGDSLDDLADRLRGIASYDSDEISDVEREWIIDALPG